MVLHLANTKLLFILVKNLKFTKQSSSLAKILLPAQAKPL